MSDSYSAWCDEIDKKIISDKKKHSDEVRNSQKYKERFKKCSDSLKTSNLHCLICCGTCGNKVVDNYKSTLGCKTLGIDKHIAAMVLQTLESAISQVFSCHIMRWADYNEN